MASGTGFYVLDLAGRTAPPLDTTESATLSIAPDGERLWAFEQGGTDLAEIDFATLNPVPAHDRPAHRRRLDVARADGGRALVAIHEQGALGATVFDALDPVTATSRRVTSLLLEGP